MAGRRADPAALKAAFRQADTNRNGTIDEQELAALLKGVPAKEVHMIFKSIDRDGSGEIGFDEFVDFVFDLTCADSQKEAKMVKKHSGVLKEVGNEDLRSIQQQEAIKKNKRDLKKVELFGARTSGDVDGVYEIETGDWLVCASAGENKYTDSHHNGHPKYRCQDVGKFMFYGKTGGREGWFVASEVPKSGARVDVYDSFNPSKYAVRPSDCCAPWESRGGRLDKRLCCQEIVRGHGIGSFDAECCLPEELWDYVSSDEGSDDASDEEDELDWKLQKRESAQQCPESSSSDVEQPPPGGGKAVPKAASEAAAKPIASEQSAVGAEAAANAGGASAAGQPPARKKRTAKSEIVHVGSQMKMAPGFQVGGPGGKKKYEDFVGSGAGGAVGAEKPPRGTVSGCPGGETGRSGASSQQGHTRGAGPPVDELAKFRDGCYVDKDFPPLASSLGDCSVKVDGWARLSTLHEKACLFHRVDADDVSFSHGAANAWFLASCACVAEYPAWIHATFGRAQALSRDCKYRIRLFHPGLREFVWVKIDDYVPTWRGSPAFAGISGDGEAWAALVEKAFAKMCGSYAGTETGEPCHGMHYVCGGMGSEIWQRAGDRNWRRLASKFHGVDTSDLTRRSELEGLAADGQTRDDELLWQVLSRYMERCFPVIAHADPDQMKGTGLTADQMYSVLCTRELPAGEKALRMVFLRDPFGLGDWHGRWGRRSDAWEDNVEVMEALQYQPGSANGTFWMSYTEFLRVFQKLSVCKKSLPIQGCHDNKHHALKRRLSVIED